VDSNGETKKGGKKGLEKTDQARMSIKIELRISIPPTAKRTGIGGERLAERKNRREILDESGGKGDIEPNLGQGKFLIK